MKRLSSGSRWALIGLLVITLLGVFYTIKDYKAHGDLLNIWWPIIGTILFGIFLWRALRTDNRMTIMALPLLLAAAASCQRGPDREHQAETRTAARADTVRPADTYAVLDSGGFERAVTVRHGW